MAITISQVQAITHDLVLKVLPDNVYKSAAGFRRFYEKRVKVSGGNDIGSPVIIGGLDDTSGGWYSGASTLNDSERDDITRAKVDWKQTYETVLISKLDIMKNGGTAQILPLLASKVQIAEKRFKARLADGVFHDGSNALKFNGLQDIIDTGSYAGLAASDFTTEDAVNAWQAQIKSNSSVDRALTGSLIQFAMGAASEDSDKPSVAFLRQNVYDQLWAILEPHQRLMAEGKGLSGLGGDQNAVLMYNGIPFLIDSHMKAKSIFFVNEDYVKLYVHSQEDMAVQSFKQLEDINAVKERMLLTGNLLCNNRRFQAELADIAVSA
jgi:hypothetical protein